MMLSDQFVDKHGVCLWVIFEDVMFTIIYFSILCLVKKENFKSLLELNNR